MKELLEKQLQFEFWANSELLIKMKEAKPLNERALLLFSHLLSASSMWLSRLNNEPFTTTLFEERTIEECESLFGKNTQGWEDYFKSVSNERLSDTIEFVSPVDNLKRRIKISDAVMHIVHHSSYHRGQIITLLKGSVTQLPLITYMPFASKKQED
jgi:uncharacterized damage-inducible protein DinB